jgi:SH3 domain protein
MAPGSEVTMRNLLLIAVLALLSWGVRAAVTTRYVTDEFQITVRSGESTSHRILRMLSSGTPVQVLSTNADTGYSQIRTADGKTGYVLTHQLMDTPSARDRVAALEKNLQDLQAEPGQLGAKLASLQQQHRQLTEAYQKLQGVKNDLEQELETIKRTSANAVRIANERNELRQNVADLTRELEGVKQQNRDLNNDSSQRWFLIGGGVLVLGIFLGLILPHLRFQRRKNSWGSL